ncbi:hypothetical protein TNCV_4746991 [Trichonephila clavipes]|nr:hypothetical protein TNCV_4746991 [Trichonephila clavipes]
MQKTALNDNEIVTSVQKESYPVDDETDEDEDNNNSESSKGPSNADAFSALETAMQWYEQQSVPAYLTTAAQENQRPCSEKKRRGRCYGKTVDRKCSHLLHSGLTAVESKLGWTELEVLGITDPTETVKEREGLSDFRGKMRILPEGGYEVELPWKSNLMNLCDNKELA